MPRDTDRFIQAVRLALQTRDIENGLASHSSQLPASHGPHASNPRPTSQKIPTASRFNTNLIIETSPNTCTVLDSPPKRARSIERGIRGKSAISDEAAITGVHPGNDGVTRPKRRLASMLEAEDAITQQQVVEGSRPKSHTSNPALRGHVDVVVLDDDSDEDCIDLTESHPEQALRQSGASYRSNGANAGPSTPGRENRVGGTDARTTVERRGLVGISVADSSYDRSIKSMVEWGSELMQPSPKRKKKKKEKRGAKYRSAPSKAALDRLERSRGHRLFLVDKTDPDGKIQCAVMGSNGNVYNCVIDLEPHCNCPDFTKRKDTNQQGPCKHLIFIFMRVLKLDCEDPRWWQRCLVQSELDELIDIAQQTHTPGASVLADEAVRTEYQKTLSGRRESERRPLEGECTICYEDLVSTDGNRRPENVITFCKKCGNNFHSACLENWFRAQSKRTCPLCRSNMGEKGTAAGGLDSEYLNLARYSRAHEQELTLEQMYADTYMYIGNPRGRRRRGASRGRGA